MKIILTLIIFTLANNIICAQTGYHEGLKAVQEKSKWGFQNKNRKWEIQPQFDSICKPFQFGFAIVQKNKQVGLVNMKGETIIPFQFEEILAEQHGLYPCKNHDNKWGMYASSGNCIIPCLYDNFRFDYKDKNLLLQQYGRWGIVSFQNEILKSPQYKQIIVEHHHKYKVLPFPQFELLNHKTPHVVHADSIYYINNELFIYTINGYQGLASDKKNLIEPIYEQIIPINKGYLACNHFEISLLNETFQLMQRLTFETMEYQKPYIIILNNKSLTLYNENLKAINIFHYTKYKVLNNNSIAILNKFNKWGILNSKGIETSSCIYDSIIPYKNVFKAYSQQKASIINENKTLISESEYAQWLKGEISYTDQFEKINLKNESAFDKIQYAHENLFWVWKANQIGLCGNTGKSIIPCLYDTIITSSNQQYYIAKQNQRFSIFDFAGKRLGGPYSKFEDMIDFAEGLASVKHKGAWGYCDIEGRILISTQYQQVHPFENGLAAIKLKGKWGYINKDERIIIQPYYEEPPVFNGKTCIITKEHHHEVLIHKQGKVALSYTCRKIIETPNGYFLFQQADTKQWGIVDESGKEIFPPHYEKISFIMPNYFIVYNHEHAGVIDDKGNIILPFKYHEIFYNETSKSFTGKTKSEWQTLVIK